MSASICPLARLNSRQVSVRHTYWNMAVENYAKSIWEECTIWGFHGGAYEECRLLRYKNPVRTTQEAHYVSATEPSRLMLRNIWGFRGSDYEESRLLGNLRRVTLARTDLSEKRFVSNIRVTIIGELGITFVACVGCYLLVIFLALRFL
jgi:hypothetical protein